MFERKYASRDCRKPRHSIVKEFAAKHARYRDERQTPADDVGFDAVDLGLIDDMMDKHLRSQISPELWARYTQPQPFCTVPEGGEKPTQGTQGRKRMPRDYTRDVPFERLYRKLQAEARARRKAGDINGARRLDAMLAVGEEPPMLTFAQIVAKAGGRVVRPQEA